MMTDGTFSVAPALAQLVEDTGSGIGGVVLVGVGVAVFLLFFALVFFATRYRRCPSNRVLVIWGKSGNQSARCYHGGGQFVWPVLEDFGYLSLEPLVIDIPLEGALSLNNIRVNVPSTFTVGIATDPVLMSNAAERLLGLPRVGAG